MMTRRNIYLQMTPLDKTLEIIQSHFFPRALQEETVAVPEAVGRILAEPVAARVSSPHFHSAAMDGIAVKAAATFGASETKPKGMRIGKDAHYVNTGNVMPDGCDAVIMIENVLEKGDGAVVIEAPVFPWQNVRKVGEDIVATEMLFARYHLITPYCIGAFLSGGIFEVRVVKPPRVLIIPTGSELVDWRRQPLKDLKPGQVLESNSYVLAELVKHHGGSFHRHPRIEDDLDVISQAVDTGAKADFDVVLIIGGSSAGSRDFAKAVVERLGRVLVHGVTMMPGKPVLVGDVEGTPVVGIPGYPVSAIVAFEQIVAPLMARMLAKRSPGRPVVTVTPSRNITSKLGVEEFVRVKLGQVGDRIVATQLPRGAGCITSITEADGIVRIDANSEGLTEKTSTIAELLKTPRAIKRTIVAVGSHDNTLDVLDDQLKANHAGVTLSSSHVGSMGGLMAIKRGVCHVAGVHLLDTHNGTYNESYINRYLPGFKGRLVNLVIRQQGLIIAPGNPKAISGIKDLGRDDITFINRQGGSGTRILLDYRLQELDLDPRSIKGYDNEEFTHMSVAVAVLSGTADAGLGIMSAARALELDFVPIVTEQYDIIIPDEFLRTDSIQALVTTLQSSAFQQRVKAMGGYDTVKTGQTVCEFK